ncbi:pyridoxamine 5'-phosphate oxidase family protein [Mycolicibacterium hodleri]|nr:pyridoxamine 5'-phosphate oxidase family protein [Mycolicibacterium hodleri]
MSDVATGFHPGELAVQRHAGVAREAARLSAMVGRGELRSGVAAFLAGATFAAITARDDAGRLWTSPLSGPAGFLKAASPTSLLIETAFDVLSGQPVGLIVMDFATRRRLRINGTLRVAGGGTLEIDVVQAYGNCPQYIHPRRPSSDMQLLEAQLIHRGNALEADDIAQVHSSDTFFLGTTHPEYGNDASHRGGSAGFVRADAHTVTWPDFPGNNMFNSLGNLAVDPAAALLFVDFRTGRTLQLAGEAAVQWADDERSVEFQVTDTVVSSIPALRYE